MTTSDQLRRLLAILPRLADGQEHRIAEIAAMLGVEPATVQQDLFELSERAGDPPGWIETVTVFVEGERVSMEAPSHFKRPMRLNGSEARTLELGLSVLRAERSPDRRASVDATIERLRALVSPEQEATVPRSVVMGRRNSLAHVDALRDALRKRRRVRLVYHKGSATEPDERTICPFSFAVEQGVWYLVAFCEKSDGIRIFRTDRIESIELLRESFEPPEGFDVETLLKEKSAFVGAAAETLRVRYSPRAARWMRERMEGTMRPDGSMEVEYPLGDQEWAIRHVLQYGADAEVLEPAAVRRAIADRLREALR
jgi:proteasome accessory factor C